MLEELKFSVCGANLSLKKALGDEYSLACVAGYDAESKIMVIPTAGYPDEPDYMLVCDLDAGVIEGDGAPSVHAQTFAEIFKTQPCGAAAIFTSPFATSFAQARKPIPPFGAAHAGVFPAQISATRFLTRAELDSGYRAELGKSVCAAVKSCPEVGAALISGHYPIVWAQSPKACAERAVLLEETAKRAALSLMLTPGLAPLSRAIIENQR